MTTWEWIGVALVVGVVVAFIIGNRIGRFLRCERPAPCWPSRRELEAHHAGTRPLPQVVCAWCQRVIREGDTSGLISHGCCSACTAALWEAKK